MDQKEILKKQIEAFRQILDAENYAPIPFERLMLQSMMRVRIEFLKLIEKEGNGEPKGSSGNTD